MVHSVSYRITRWLIEWRAPLLMVGLVTAVLSYGPAHRLEFDRSIENMFADDDPILEPYRELKRVFGGNEIGRAGYVDPQLLTLEGLQRVERLTAQMREVPGVHAVLSLTTTPVGIDLYDSPLREPFLELLRGYTIGADNQTTAVVCMLEPVEQATATRESTVVRLRQLIRDHDPTGVLTGEPVMVVEGFQSLEDDGERLGRMSTLFLMLTIILCFRSLRWVIVPVAVVNLTLWLTKAVLVVGQLRLSMVSSMLWAIVTATGIAMVTHIIVRFREVRDAGRTPYEALLACGGVGHADCLDVCDRCVWIWIVAGGTSGSGARFRHHDVDRIAVGAAGGGVDSARLGVAGEHGCRSEASLGRGSLG